MGFGWFAFGYLMHTKIRLRALKREMRLELSTGNYNSEEVITLTFKQADFASPKTAPEKVDKHEIRWQGKMYDVVSASFQHGQLVIQCIPDEQETELLARFLHFVKDKMGDKKQGLRQTQFSFWHFVNATPFVFQPLQPIVANGPFIHYSFGFSSFEPGVPVPPPWRVA